MDMNEDFPEEKIREIAEVYLQDPGMIAVTLKSLGTRMDILADKIKEQEKEHQNLTAEITELRTTLELKEAEFNAIINSYQNSLKILNTQKNSLDKYLEKFIDSLLEERIAKNAFKKELRKLMIQIVTLLLAGDGIFKILIHYFTGG